MTKQDGKIGKEEGAPLSKFIIEIVVNSLSEEADFKPRGGLIEEIGKLRGENKELRYDLKTKEDRSREVWERTQALPK